METFYFFCLVAVVVMTGFALNLLGSYLQQRLDLERERLEAETYVEETEPAVFTLQPERGPWTTEDATRTREFFRSPTGLRFAEQLRYSEGALLLRAIHAPTEDQPALCGQAAGYRQLLHDITKLFSPSAESADNSQPGPEQAGEG